MTKFKIISHRGNISGPYSKYENHPHYIKEALLQGFDVEIDIRLYKNKFYLGHDPINDQSVEISESFLDTKGLWIHAKDLGSLSRLLKLDLHCFFHNKDDFTLTSKNYIWTYPGNRGDGEKSILVMPEFCNFSNKEIRDNYVGICTDYPEYYSKNLL